MMKAKDNILRLTPKKKDKMVLRSNKILTTPAVIPRNTSSSTQPHSGGNTLTTVFRTPQASSSSPPKGATPHKLFTPTTNSPPSPDTTQTHESEVDDESKTADDPFLGTVFRGYSPSAKVSSMDKISKEIVIEDLINLKYNREQAKAMSINSAFNKIQKSTFNTKVDSNVEPIKPPRL